MSKVIYNVNGKQVVEQYNGVELVSITIDEETIFIGKSSHKVINEIVKYLVDNIDIIITEGIMIVDIIEEPTKHPHYHSRTYKSIEYGDDDYGVKTIIYDLGLSGSPSAWNHYITTGCLTLYAEWIHSDNTS